MAKVTNHAAQSNTSRALASREGETLISIHVPLNKPQTASLCGNSTSRTIQIELSTRLVTVFQIAVPIEEYKGAAFLVFVTSLTAYRRIRITNKNVLQITNAIEQIHIRYEAIIVSAVGLNDHLVDGYFWKWLLSSIIVNPSASAIETQIKRRLRSRGQHSPNQHRDKNQN
jgi:hypothetical protein